MLLRTRDEYLYEPRGILPFKGKGEMEAYLLEGRRARVAGANAPAASPR